MFKKGDRIKVLESNVGGAKGKEGPVTRDAYSDEGLVHVKIDDSISYTAFPNWLQLIPAIKLAHEILNKGEEDEEGGKSRGGG